MKLYKITISPTSNFATSLKGDTLFGQMCWAIRYTFGNERLESLLSSYEDSPFLVVSDGFPNGFLPKPTMPSHLLGENSDEKKTNRKKVWLTLEEIFNGRYDKARTNEEIKNCEKKTSIVKNSLNYLTFHTSDDGTFAPYAIQEIALSDRDVYFLINTALFSKDELINTMRFVSQMGYGKESSTGKGFFEVGDFAEINIAQTSKSFMTLSPCSFENIGFKECYYEPFTRFGKHGAGLSNKNPFKKPLLMANSGAVVMFDETCNKPYIGKAIKGHSAHKDTVHQGYSIIMPISLKGES